MPAVLENMRPNVDLVCRRKEWVCSMKQKATNAASNRYDEHQIHEALNVNNVRLIFEHLGLALSVWQGVWQLSEPEDSRVDVLTHPHSIDGSCTQSNYRKDDAFVSHLAEALAIAEAADDMQSAICAEALRFAILARQVIGVERDQSTTSAANLPANRPYRPLPKWRLRRVLDYVDDNLDERITLQHMASVAGLSRMHFAAQFRAATGQRPHDYLLKRRVDRAKDFLRKGDLRLAEIALSVGFQTQAHFTTVFKRFAGDTPHQWRSTRLAPAELSLARDSTREL